MTLTIDLPEDGGAGHAIRPAAREFLDQVVRHLTNYLTKSRDEGGARWLQPREAALQDALTREREVAARMKALEAEMRAATGRVDVSPDQLGKVMNRLDEERMRLEIEQAAKNARRQALTKALAEATKKLDERVKEDPVVAELRQIVEGRARKLELVRKMAEAGQANNVEVDEAAAAVADARARMLERQQQAMEQAGGDIVSSWNRELMALSVDEHELLSRVEQVGQRLEKMRGMIEQLGEMEQLQERREHARAAMRDAEESLRDATRRIRELQAIRDLSVIDAVDAKQPPATNPSR